MVHNRPKLFKSYNPIAQERRRALLAAGLAAAAPAALITYALCKLCWKYIGFASKLKSVFGS